MKILAGIVGGLLMAIIGALLVTTTFAASPQTGGGWGAISFFVLWIVAIAIAVLSKSASKAWKKLLITSSLLSFLLPLSGLIYTGSFMAKHVDSSAEYAGAQAAGAAIGGGLLSGLMGFVGFFLGVVLLIVGLLIGRDKQIVYVQAQDPSKSNELNNKP